MSSKTCACVLGSVANTALLLDFDGVCILDGGFSESSKGFMEHFRDITAIFLSAPTLGNLGTTSALLKQNDSLPVLTNTKPINSAKPETSGELVKSIQVANSKLISDPPLFNPKYPAHIIYQSIAKGVLSLYILAGDSKDAEVITKALVSGNEAEVERAASEHGTIGVLLWRPAEVDKPAIRVLLSGTSTLARIQQSLDKAAKFLPFLNKPIVRSKDALSDSSAPVAPRNMTSSARNPRSKPAASAPSARPVSTNTVPRALTSRAPPPINSSSRSGSRPSAHVPPRANAPLPSRVAKPSASVKPSAHVSIPAKAQVPKRAPVPKQSQPIAPKKTSDKVRVAAPSRSGASAPRNAPTSAVPPPSALSSATPSDSNGTIVLDDSIIIPKEVDQGSGHKLMNIVAAPPATTTSQHENAPAKKNKEESREEPVEESKAMEKVDKNSSETVVEDEKPGEPVSDDLANRTQCVENLGYAENMAPVPVYVSKELEPESADSSAPADVTPVDLKQDDILGDYDPIEVSLRELPANEILGNHVIISTPASNYTNIAVSPFLPPTSLVPNSRLFQLHDRLQQGEPVLEELVIPQTPSNGDCNGRVSKLEKTSMDTDKTKEAASEAVGEMTQLSADLQNLGLDEKTGENVRKLSGQMIEDAALPFTSALASSIISSIGHPEQVDQEQALEPKDHSIPKNELQDHQKEVPKHDLMLSRSSVIGYDAQVDYEKTDHTLDDVLSACAQESEKLDSASSSPSYTDNSASPPRPNLFQKLYMPAAPGVPIIPKSVKFARPYYFDVVTVPRNEKLKTTVSAAGLQEFISKIRSRNVILASKEISADHLQAILIGKQSWCDSTHPCSVIPTHSSTILLDFQQNHEQEFPTNHLSWAIPVHKQPTTVSSEAGAIEYELVKVAMS